MHVPPPERRGEALNAHFAGWICQRGGTRCQMRRDPRTERIAPRLAPQA
jgi:hypothetical protein